MLQRIQTLFLIIAIGLTIAFFFIPFGYAPVIDNITHQSMLQPLKGSEFIGLIIPASASILFMVVSIFLYRNYPMQKFFTALSAISLLATIGVVIYAVVNPYIDGTPYVTIATVWGGGGLFIVAALIAVFAAYHYIAKDQRLIRSYDRIR